MYTLIVIGYRKTDSIGAVQKHKEQINIFKY